MPALRAFSQYRLGLELTQMSQLVSRRSPLPPHPALCPGGRG